MSRARISTTIDAQRLARARALSGLSDSKLLDRALLALLDRLEEEREIAALTRYPYDDDPELSWEVPAAPLPYDADVPEEIVELARLRRTERPR
jgi:hypothetical protein